MKIFFAIAWRNVMRNKKRSFITVFAIAVGLTAMIFMWSLYDGVFPMVVENMTSMFMGHMELAKPQFVDKPHLEYAVTDGTQILEAIAADAGVESYSPRLTAFGLVTYGDHSQGAAITGIDPELERRVGRVDDAVQEGGSFLQGGDRLGALIGSKLAQNIDVGIGDEILIVTSNRFNNLSYVGPLPIVGIVDTKLPDIDSSMIFVDRRVLAEAIFIDESIEFTNPDARITDTEGVFTSVAIRVKDQDDLQSVRARLQNAMPDDVQIRTWNEIVPWYEQMVEFRVAFGYIVLAIMLIIVVAGILNTVLMSVMERTREFGIMRALGTKGWQIFATVSLESIFLGLIGIAVGAACGIVLVLFFGYVGLDIYSSFDTDIMGHFYVFDTVVYPRLNLDNFLNICLIVLGCVALVSLYPARKASKMEPVSAIKALG